MSSAVWACLTAHVCNNWTNYTLLTSLPTFMKEVLKFDIKSNGALSALPYICQAVSGFLAGQTADIIRSKRILNTTHTRKFYQISAFIGAGAMSVAVGYTDCDQRAVAVALLSLAVMFTGLCRAGFTVNHVDIAPKYAGVLYGITNTMATVPGMLAPIVAGELTPNKSQSEWRYVFFVCAGFDVFGAIIYGLFGSGTIQDWARDEVEIEVIMSNEKSAGKNNAQPKNQVTNDDNSTEESKEEDLRGKDLGEEEGPIYNVVVKHHEDPDLEHSGGYNEDANDSARTIQF